MFCSLAMAHLILFTFFATAGAISSTSLQDIPKAVSYHPKAFTPAECDTIIKQMKQLPVEYDDRVDKSVKRTNYFDKGSSLSSEKYKWIFDRILPLYSPKASMKEFVSGIDFILLHEFKGGGFFDWHVDVKPGDNTGRTDNINVMLSERSQYEGGELVVGGSEIPAQQGDCYSYPASFPHKVADITKGVRHTFIIAMKSSELSTPDRQKYWEKAEATHKKLCASNPSVPKLHLIHGEFLAALGRPDSEVDAKFADMYASTPEAEQYCNNFLDQGQMLQEAGRTEESSGYLNMANMIRARIDSRDS